MAEEGVRGVREDVEIPRVGSVRIAWVLLNGRESASVRSGVNICSVFNFDRLGEVAHGCPKFALHVIFRHRPLRIGDGIERHLVREVRLLEVVRLLLELLERINASFFETEFACADETARTVPIVSRDALDGRVKTVSMVTSIAAVA